MLNWLFVVKYENMCSRFQNSMQHSSQRANAGRGPLASPFARIFDVRRRVDLTLRQ